MDKSSQAAFNGSAKPGEANVHSHLGQVQHPTQSILAYMTAVSNGDAPINTLLQLHSPEAEIAARRAKVNREVEDALAKLNKGSNHSSNFYRELPSPLKID